MYSQINLFGVEVETMIFIYSLGGVFAAASFLLKRKLYNFSLKDAILYASILITTGMLELKLMGTIRVACISLLSGGTEIPNPSVRIFGAILFQPILCFILSKITGDRFRKLIDSFAPETFLYFVFGKVSCILEGCCFGIPYENGVQTSKFDQLVFPVQTYEAISVLFATIILYILAIKKNNLRTGSLFPIGIILFSVPRFFWENYRYYELTYEKDFFLSMTFWQLCCLIAIITSIIWLVILYKKDTYKYCSFEKSSDTLFAVIIKNITKLKRKKNKKNIVHHKKKK